LSKKAKIKTEKYEGEKNNEKVNDHVELTKKLVQRLEKNGAQNPATNLELTNPTTECQTPPTVDPILWNPDNQEVMTRISGKSEKKGKKVILKKFLKDVGQFAKEVSGSSEGSGASDIDVLSVKSEDRMEKLDVCAENGAVGEYVPGEGLKTSYNC